MTQNTVGNTRCLNMGQHPVGYARRVNCANQKIRRLNNSMWMRSARAVSRNSARTCGMNMRTPGCSCTQLHALPKLQSVHTDYICFSCGVSSKELYQVINDTPSR